MRFLRIALILSLVVLGATTAWAQYGLYGSPQMLYLPNTGPAAIPAAGYNTVAAYPVARPNMPALPLSAAPAPEMPKPPTPEGIKNDSPGPNAELAKDTDNGYGCAGCYESCGGDCASCGCAPACCPWYASAQALVMSRNQPNRLWTSYETGDESNQVQHSQLGMEWRWGGEIRFGRRFCCGCDTWALEATYWTLDQFSGFASVSLPGGVSTPLELNVGNVQFDGTAASVWFDNSPEHRLWRRDEIHSVELNLIRDQINSGYTMLDVDWALGVRFFRFEDRFIFGAVRSGHAWGDGGYWEAFLDDQVVNNLIGVQIGCNLEYRLSSAWSLHFMPKFGIYNNHITNLFQAHLGDGTVATSDGGTYPVNSSADTISFLTQLDLGLDCRLSQRWSARIGYRLLVATGIGLADNQIPFYIVDVPEISDIDYNGELVLHGGYAGLTYNF